MEIDLLASVSDSFVGQVFCHSRYDERGSIGVSIEDRMIALSPWWFVDTFGMSAVFLFVGSVKMFLVR